MKRSRFGRRPLGAALGLLLLSATPALGLSVVAQDRSVFAEALAEAPAGFDSVFDEDGATDLGPFSGDVGAQAAVTPISGSSAATQTSQIDAAGATAVGDAQASGSAAPDAGPGFGTYAAESFFELLFDAEAPRLTLTGSLSSDAGSDGDGFASLELFRVTSGAPDTLLLELEVSQGDDLVFDTFQRLVPGERYRVTAFALGIALPSALVNDASGSGAFSLTVAEVPEPGTAALVGLGLLVLGLSRRNRSA